MEVTLERLSGVGASEKEDGDADGNKEVIGNISECEQQVNGVVKWFLKDRGYGFISYNGKDFFVHFSDIISEGFKNLFPNQPVKFFPTQGSKGWIAKKVMVG